MGLWDKLKSLVGARDYGGKGGKVDKRYRLDASQWADSGLWVRVKSSNVAGIQFDKKAGVLSVEFHTSGVYPYFNVPTRVAKRMFECPSMGKFVHRVLIPNYETISKAKGATTYLTKGKKKSKKRGNHRR